MSARIVLLTVVQFGITYSLNLAKTEIAWKGKCVKEKLAMNDCNLCYCNMNQRYVCRSRTCSAVDIFGHFNDAIRDIDVGMEGKGVWRSEERACEPGVEYRRGDLLCICGDDGTWPSPVCRDIFRVLHILEVIDEKEPNNQKCTPTKLYLIGCKVCFCPSQGIIDSEFCTKQFCEGDSILSNNNQNLDEENVKEDYAVYATCNPDQKYKLGCKNCVCLKNNRLHCDNCTNTNINSYCGSVTPGHVFSRDCNLCYCDKDDYSYCTARKCLPSKNRPIKNPFDDTDSSEKVTDLVNDTPVAAENCEDGKIYTKDCNICKCSSHKGKKYFSCTLKLCDRTKNLESMYHDCVDNTVYEHNCLLCSCEVINGTKIQVCEVSADCNNGNYERSSKLDLMHGYCEPLRFFKIDCNDCRCLSDARTLMCTSRICSKPDESIAVDLIPVTQIGEKCPKGASYKIDCNFCFCLSNGNAICTTVDCNKSRV